MIEAMKQWLKALEKVKRRAVVMGSTGDYREGQLDALKAVSEDVKPAITSLRQAIKELESQEPVAIAEEWTPCTKLPLVVHVRQQRNGEAHVSTREGITPIKPDDLIMRGVSGEEYPIGRAIFQQTYTLDIHPPQRTEPEPVAWTLLLVGEHHGIIGKAGEKFLGHPEHYERIDVYTHPPQRTWVGLTEDDKVLIKHDANFNQFMTAGEYADRVQQLTEARLKEKNT